MSPVQRNGEANGAIKGTGRILVEGLGKKTRKSSRTICEIMVKPDGLHRSRRNLDKGAMMTGFYQARMN